MASEAGLAIFFFPSYMQLSAEIGFSQPATYREPCTVGFQQRKRRYVNKSNAFLGSYQSTSAVASLFQILVSVMPVLMVMGFMTVPELHHFCPVLAREIFPFFNSVSFNNSMTARSATYGRPDLHVRGVPW
jgi:hypothetical protein